MKYPSVYANYEISGRSEIAEPNFWISPNEEEEGPAKIRNLRPSTNPSLTSYALSGFSNHWGIGSSQQLPDNTAPIYSSSYHGNQAPTNFNEVRRV